MKTNQIVVIVLTILAVPVMGCVFLVGGVVFFAYRTMPVEDAGPIEDAGMRDGPVVSTEETKTDENTSDQEPANTAWSSVSISFRFYADGKPMRGGNAEFIPADPSESPQNPGQSGNKSTITPSGLCAGVLLEPGTYKVVVNSSMGAEKSEVPAERYRKFDTTPLTVEVKKGDDFQIVDDFHLASE